MQDKVCTLQTSVKTEKNVHCNYNACEPYFDHVAPTSVQILCTFNLPTMPHSDFPLYLVLHPPVAYLHCTETTETCRIIPWNRSSGAGSAHLKSLIQSGTQCDQLLLQVSAVASMSGVKSWRNSRILVAQRRNIPHTHIQPPHSWSCHENVIIQHSVITWIMTYHDSW